MYKVRYLMSDIIHQSENIKTGIFNPIGEKRLFQKVVDQIRVAIFQGKLRQGDKLPPEEELVTIFRVSRSAVREAVKVLESAGLLVVRRGHGGGTFVRERDISSLVSAYADLLRLSLVDVSELTRTREILESAVIRQLGNNISSQDFENLRWNIREAERHHLLGENEKRLTLNIDFHVALARLSRNVVLELNVTAVVSLLHYYLVATKVTPEMGQATIESHLQITDFLERGAIDEAMAANQAHIEDISQRLTVYAEATSPTALLDRHLIG